MKSFKTYWVILKKSFSKFADDGVLTHAAALSYYTIFSLPPMLLIIVSVAARFYNEEDVRSSILDEIATLVGPEAALQLMNTLNKLSIHEPTWWATALGIGVLMFTATTVFVTMQNALNIIFEVKPVETKAFGLLKMLRDRVISFTLLISIAFILLVSLAVDALLAAFGNLLKDWIGDISTVLVFLTSVVLPLAVVTLLFAMLFKFLPDVKLRWKDTWVGAVLTALLFELGKFLIGFYIGNSATTSVYEAAGSVLIVMIWVYYASAIFLFGSTFTFVRAMELNQHVEPADYAVKVKQLEVNLEEGADVADAP